MNYKNHLKNLLFVLAVFISLGIVATAYSTSTYDNSSGIISMVSGDTVAKPTGVQVNAHITKARIVSTGDSALNVDLRSGQTWNGGNIVLREYISAGTALTTKTTQLDCDFDIPQSGMVFQCNNSTATLYLYTGGQKVMK